MHNSMHQMRCKNWPPGGMQYCLCCLNGWEKLWSCTEIAVPPRYWSKGLTYLDKAIFLDHGHPVWKVKRNCLNDLLLFWINKRNYLHNPPALLIAFGHHRYKGTAVTVIERFLGTCPLKISGCSEWLGLLRWWGYHISEVLKCHGILTSLGFPIISMKACCCYGFQVAQVSSLGKQPTKPDKLLDTWDPLSGFKSERKYGSACDKHIKTCTHIERGLWIVWCNM